jgi:hypothetical protein
MNSPTPVMSAPPAAGTKSPPGTKNLLMGPPGSGKTHALRTLLDCHPNLKIHCIFTEPSGMTILGDTPPERFHWQYVQPSKPSISALIEQATALNTFTQQALQGMANVNPQNYKQYIELLAAMAKLKCERTGLEIGPIDQLGTDWVVCFDSLSPINNMCMDLVAGGKPFKTMSDWGAGIDQQTKFLNFITLATRCHIVLTAHLTREIDEVMGGTKILPNAIGKKLPQEMNRFFDDIVLTSIESNQFKWATSVANVDAKARRLKLGKDFQPSFKPIFDVWLARGGII